MSVEEKLRALDDIIAKLRYVKYGDIWLSADHNDPVDAIKASRELSVALNDRIKNMKFLDLIDTPSSYSGQGGKVVSVKSTEDGLEFTSLVAGAHASTHYATGSDPLLGWLAPSHIAPKSDTVADVIWRTRNIADTQNLDHRFRPQTDMYGYLGDDDYRWGYASIAYESIWWLYLCGASEAYVPYDANTDYMFHPYSDGYSYVGMLGHRFREVRAVSVIQGDLGFEEDRCMVCGKPFKENDSIVLKVRKIDKENKKILAVPVHAECNPHKISDEMLEYHEKNVLSPRKNPKDELLYKMPNPEIGFEIVLESPVDDELMYVQAKFEDGISVCPIVRINASEEEVINAIKEAYLHEKKRIISKYERKLRGREKLMKLGKSWKGYKGKITV